MTVRTFGLAMQICDSACILAIYADHRYTRHIAFDQICKEILRKAEYFVKIAMVRKEPILRTEHKEGTTVFLLTQKSACVPAVFSSLTRYVFGIKRNRTAYSIIKNTQYG